MSSAVFADRARGSGLQMVAPGVPEVRHKDIDRPPVQVGALSSKGARIGRFERHQFQVLDAAQV